MVNSNKEKEKGEKVAQQLDEYSSTTQSRGVMGKLAVLDPRPLEGGNANLQEELIAQKQQREKGIEGNL